ncbi:MAG: M56 family metallopeptidase [Ilumatobacter sp.]|uniref:M56 family metallopeptidase n=1 Tax=Ilumatobacter sp. TaxID=1967498 RepID=UPI00391AF23F
MINFVALPLLVTLGVAAVGSRRLDRLHPATAARCSAVLLAAVAIATVPTLWLIGLSGLAHMGWHNPVFDWSQHLMPDYQPFGAVVGISSLIAALAGTARAVRVLTHHRRLRCTDTCPVEFIDTDEVYAYTLPGPARTIAISDGLRKALDDNEFDVVLAHEQAHARHRHDRFKLLALLTTAFIPMIIPIKTRLDFYLERWADEEALEHTGAERRLAARTIAKVALASPSPRPALGIADHGVAARAAALLEPIELPDTVTRLQTSMIIATTLLLTAYQVHHSVMFAGDLVR